MENQLSTSHGAVLKRMEEKLLTLKEQYLILMDQKEQGELIVGYIKDRRQTYENLSGRRYWENQTQLTIDILNVKRDELITKIGRKMVKIEQIKAAIEDEDKENTN